MSTKKNNIRTVRRKTEEEAKPVKPSPNGVKLNGVHKSVHVEAVDLPPAPQRPNPIEWDTSGDFAKMLDESVQAAKLDIDVGDVVRATLVHTSKDAAFFSLGPKIEGIMDLVEIKNADGGYSVTLGQTIWTYVVAFDDHIRLSKKIANQRANLQILEEAKASRIPVEGQITGVNSGGLEVTIGATRAFCPISQIDLAPVTDASSYVGQTLLFLVTQISGSNKGLNVVLSRRAILEKEREQLKKDKKDPFSLAQETLQIGADLPGRVVRLEKFGAFIELSPGVQGMVHISELSHKRIRHPEDVVKVGEEVVVRVLDVDTEKQRIALSIKEGVEKPAPQAADSRPKSNPKTSFGTLGDLMKAKVSR